MDLKKNPKLYIEGEVFYASKIFLSIVIFLIRKI